MSMKADAALVILELMDLASKCKSHYVFVSYYNTTDRFRVDITDTTNGEHKTMEEHARDTITFECPTLDSDAAVKTLGEAIEKVKELIASGEEPLKAAV